MEFITAEERQALEQRLEKLKANRPHLSRRIAEARELGDLAENAEYHAAREEQGLQEAEIRRLEQRLKNANTIDESQIPDDIVFLGATVRLRDAANDDEDLYRLVGESSGNFDLDVIEVTTGSPMGQALMKARLGETIKVDMPRGTRRFTVMEIL